MIEPGFNQDTQAMAFCMREKLALMPADEPTTPLISWVDAVKLRFYLLRLMRKRPKYENGAGSPQGGCTDIVYQPPGKRLRLEK